MQENLIQLAERIKGLREVCGVTANTLAHDLGITPEIYLEYESGTKDIPVSILFKIAHRFNVELSSLLTGEEPRLHTYAVTRKGQGVSVERRKDYQYQSLAHIFADKQAEPFLVTVGLESANSPVTYNSHPGQEFNFCLEGELMVYLDNREIVLKEGDALYFDSGIKHGMKALNGKSARFLAVIV